MKKNLNLTDAALVALQNITANLRARGIKKSEGAIISEAIIQYALASQEEYSRSKVDLIIQDALDKQINRLAAMIGSVGMDVSMLLMDTLEQRLNERSEISGGITPKMVYDDLRNDARKYFARKHSFWAEFPMMAPPSVQPGHKEP